MISTFEQVRSPGLARPDLYRVLYLPLWLKDAPSFMSSDYYGHLVTKSGVPVWTPQGHYFDGTDDELDCGSSGALLLGSGDFTLTFCVYKTSLSDKEYLMGTAGGNRDVYLSGTAGAIAIKLEGATLITTNTGLITINVWLLLGIVRSGNDCIIYKNGQIFQTITNGFASGNNTTSEGLILGYNS